MKESSASVLTAISVVSQFRGSAVNDHESEILPTLLFHLLVFEDLAGACDAPEVDIRTEFDGEVHPWGIGPQGKRRGLHEKWYQPYRHDIIGNTLSADLLDYLLRDARRLGMRNTLDVKLLEYYVLVQVPAAKERVTGESQQTAVTFGPLARCAIDLNDYKRGVIRSERINDVFRMLDFRHEIHEKAVYHRVVQSAIAMAARAVTLTGSNRPTVESLYGIGEPLHALRGDEHFLARLADITRRRPPHSLVHKLIERRVYRPLMIIPGDQAHELLQGTLSPGDTNPEEGLRLLGAILDSTYFAPFLCLVCWCVERLLDHSLENAKKIDEFIEQEVCSGKRRDWAMQCMPRRLILWTTPYKQLYKDPAIVVRAGDLVGRIDEFVGRKVPGHEQLQASVRTRLAAGLADSESRYAAMWKVYVFISDGLYNSGGLARLIPDHPCRGSASEHKKHLEEAQDYLIRAILVACEWWSRRLPEDGADLSEPISPDQFLLLLRVLITQDVRYQAMFARNRSAFSSVDVDAYVHVGAGNACRDIRYRFDVAADVGRCVREAGLPSSAEDSIQSMLQLAKIDIKLVSHEELADFVTHLGPQLGGSELLNLDRAARDGNLIASERLRAAWREAEFDQEAHDDRSGRATISPRSGDGQPGGTRQRRRRAGQTDTARLELLDASNSTGDDRAKLSDSSPAAHGPDDPEGGD